MEKFDITQINLEELRQVDVRTVDPATLVDINNLNIDTALPKEERLGEFVRQIGNPYCFKVGKVAVSVGFAGDGPTFEKCMEHYLQTL
jgi:hypothetical protein